MSSVDTSPAPEPAHKKKGAHGWTKGEVYHLEGSETTGELALRVITELQSVLSAVEIT